jgi:hypothetical protein
MPISGIDIGGREYFLVPCVRMRAIRRRDRAARIARLDTLIKAACALDKEVERRLERP